MKKIKFLLFSSIFLIQACNTNQESSNTISNQSNKSSESSILPSKQEKEIDLINQLDKDNSKEIVGLWKVYKTKYADGSTSVESDNSFLEIKSDGMYEENSRKGAWFLSFAKSDSTGIISIFNKVEASSYSSELRLSSYAAKKINENNTSFLVLTEIENNAEKYYIRQQ